jgi:hypothetical protein
MLFDRNSVDHDAATNLQPMNLLSFVNRVSMNELRGIAATSLRLDHNVQQDPTYYYPRKDFQRGSFQDIVIM